MNTQKMLSLPALMLTLLITGCSDAPPSTGGTGSDAVTAIDSSTEMSHSHPTEGPHHGVLIELGAEEYHGELVHDEAAGTVTVWILDSTAKTTVPIDAEEITINLRLSDRGEQYRLQASAEAGDPPDRSSRFLCTDRGLGEDLHQEDAQAMLALSIEGRAFRGSIPHRHHHADHAHGHHHAHDHDHAGQLHERH